MARFEIHDQMGMMDLIQEIGFLPLLDSGIAGFSAEEMADEECRYVVFPDGGWDWPLWKWKGPIVTESRFRQSFLVARPDKLPPQPHAYPRGGHY